MKNNLILILISLFIVSCNKKEKLYVFNWTDYIGENTIKDFEEKYNVDVIYDNYSSNEELLSKLITGGDSYDVIFPSGYTVEILLEKDMLSTLNQNLLSNKQNIPDKFSNPDFDPDLNYCIPYTWSTTGIGYDSSVISEDEVNSWSVFFNEKYKDQILLLDDHRATIGAILKYLNYSANSKNIEELKQVQDTLLSQKELVHLYTNDNLPQLLGSGEVKLGYAWSGDISQATKINSNVKFSIPKEGTLMYIDYICIPKGSKNVDLATKFINFILDGKVSLGIAKTTFYATTNSKAQSFADSLTMQLWSPLKEFGAEQFEEVKNLGEFNKNYEDIWTSLK